MTGTFASLLTLLHMLSGTVGHTAAVAVSLTKPLEHPSSVSAVCMVYLLMYAVTTSVCGVHCRHIESANTAGLVQTTHQYPGKAQLDAIVTSTQNTQSSREPC